MGGEADGVVAFVLVGAAVTLFATTGGRVVVVVVFSGGETVGVAVEFMVGAADSLTGRAVVVMFVMIGDNDGVIVGFALVGDRVGEFVGLIVGTAVGALVGNGVGGVLGSAIASISSKSLKKSSTDKAFTNSLPDFLTMSRTIPEKLGILVEVSPTTSIMMLRSPGVAS